MNDLRTLFGPDTGSERRARASSSATSDETSSLLALVGSPLPSAAADNRASSDRLLALVGPSEILRSDSASSDLTALVGGLERAPRHSTSNDLSALVGIVGATAAGDGWRAPELAQAGKRPLFGGRRKAGAVNYLSLAAAVLAVVVLVGTASVAVVQRATANPADDAMVSLREREAELANETKALQTAADLYKASIAEATALGQESASVLTGLQGRVDAGPLAAAEASRVSLLSAASSAPSVVVPIYSRVLTDEKDLADVGKAIDAVRVARESLPALVTDVRDDRANIVGALASYREALRGLGNSIESGLSRLIAENSSAPETFRNAVADAAGRIRASQQAGGDGLADMPTYAAAVDALRAENARIVALEEAEREATPNRPTNPNGGNSNNRDPDSESSDPGTPSPEPSQPAPSPDPEPSPEPSQPEPTPDPEPTEPSVPNPDPSAPIEGGTA